VLRVETPAKWVPARFGDFLLLFLLLESLRRNLQPFCEIIDRVLAGGALYSHCGVAFPVFLAFTAFLSFLPYLSIIALRGLIVNQKLRVF
jgi:hypothetical protein